ncbi:sensor histidine kinase [Streptococcus parasanguinis]|uniref:sensor histidine kinase n=1 Tax=Streptococcus parasanguinis TaxID=1318 RepID=UPI00352D30DC
MAKELTIKQLIKRTYLTIIWQFLLCLTLFYIIPALLSSVSGINEKNANRFALFFSVSSWIYLCIILIVIIVINIRQLLTKIQKEMKMVYHSSLYFNKNDNPPLQIKEFIETNDLIEKMQSDIKHRIQNEKDQKKELMFQVSSAAHDLRSPLTVIRGNAEFLQSTEQTPQAMECLKDLEQASIQLNDYFNHFIQYSKTFYDQDIQLENISINQVSHQLKEQITPLLPRNTNFVFSNTVTPSTQIAIHSNLFSRAITNIINNAIQHQQDNDAKIQLTMSQDNGQLVLTIWNNQSSFSKNVFQHAGNLFYKEDQARTPSQESHFGLGLSFVKRVMKLHNGTMHLENIHNGAQVKLIIPIII